MVNIELTVGRRVLVCRGEWEGPKGVGQKGEEPMGGMGGVCGAGPAGSAMLSWPTPRVRSLG